MNLEDRKVSPSEGLKQHIHECMGKMSNSERKVARALLSNYPTAGLTTVAELAVSAGVSAPTVMRCVNRLGFTGFPVFQKALIREINELGSPLKQYDYKREMSSKERVLNENESSFVDMIRASYNGIPESEYIAAVDLIANNAKRIVVSGGRFSGFLAGYFVAHLRLLRPNVQLIGLDDIDQRIAIAESSSSTVLVVFDYRRYASQSRVLAERMHQRGALVCLLTDKWLSPISAMSRVVLPAHVDSVSPFDSLVAATAVVETVIAGVTERLGPEGIERLTRAEGSLDAP